MGYSRRSFLRRAAVATGVTAGAIVVFPSPHPDQPTDRPVEAHTGTLPEIELEEESPYALWQYSRERDGYNPTSPINVVFTLAGTDRTLDDVMHVFTNVGWVERPAEYVRFAYNAHTGSYERQHASAAQTFHGGFGRHHIRAWDFEGYVSVQAHEDTAATPEHEIVSYESTKHLIEWLFHERGWSVEPDGASFDNANPPDHEGLVTVIVP